MHSIAARRPGGGPGGVIWCVLSLAGGLLFVAAFAAPPPTAQAGQAAYDHHDPALALSLWSAAAAAGDMQAIFNMGVLYDLGDGVAPDPARAFDCYRSAAEGGIAAAAFNAAVMLDNGRGVPRNAAQAATWYARAAAQGHARAAYNLAQLYSAGEGVPRNPDQSEQWYRAASASGIAAATRAVTAALRPAARVVTAGSLVAAEPVGGSHLRAGPDGQQLAELVWRSPLEPVPTHFLVSVLARDADGLHPVFSRTTFLSAMQIAVPDDSRPMVWRVYTVAAGAPHYAASTWSELTPRAGP